ncbi:MAG: hypothetical protein AABX38_00160 [Candidatus Micrarchaeota archaeon]
MAKSWVRGLVFIVAVAIGYFVTTIWGQLRPEDDSTTVLIVGVVVTLASFVAMYFMTKGGGD